MVDPGQEPKVEKVLDVAAQIAGIAGSLPTPAALPLTVFAELYPILGPIAFEAFGHLFHHIKHAKDPKAAANAVLVSASVAVEPYVDTTSLYGG